MKETYNILELLNPIKLQEQDSNATEAEDVESTDNKDEDDIDKNQTDEKKSDDTEKKSDEEIENSEETQETEASDKQDEQTEKDEKDSDKKAKDDQSAKAVQSANKQILSYATELDNIYKNNNLQKYGKSMVTTYQGSHKAIWVTIGILAVVTITVLCINGIIPIRKVLPKIPLIGKLFQGDKAAINDVNSTVLGNTVDSSTQSADTQTNATEIGMNQEGTQVNGATQTQDDFEAIKKRIANKQASDEDMQIAYEEYKKGNYTSAGPATKAYFSALDQGKPHDEAQKIADANNPKLQQVNVQQQNPSIKNVAQQAQQAANNNQVKKESAGNTVNAPKTLINKAVADSTSNAPDSKVGQVVQMPKMAGTVSARLSDGSYIYVAHTDKKGVNNTWFRTDETGADLGSGSCSNFELRGNMASEIGRLLPKMGQSVNKLPMFTGQ